MYINTLHSYVNKVNNKERQTAYCNIFGSCKRAQGGPCKVWCCELDRVSDANVVTLSLYSSVLPTHVYLFKVEMEVRGLVFSCFFVGRFVY